MIYKSSDYDQVKKAKQDLYYLLSKDSIFEIKEISLKRTNLQNKSLHLFFKSSRFGNFIFKPLLFKANIITLIASDICFFVALLVL